MLLITSLNFILLIGLTKSSNLLLNENPLNNVLSTFRLITKGCNQAAIVIDEFEGFLKDSINLTIVNQVNKSDEKIVLNQFFQDLCYEKHKYSTYVSKATVTLLACTNATEKYLVETGANLLQKSIEYICYKNGKRIALFFWRDGYECLTNNTEAIQDCNTGILDAKSLINCQKYSELQKCVGNAIKNCDVLTPINMIYAFMRHLHLQLSCNEKA